MAKTRTRDEDDRPGNCFVIMPFTPDLDPVMDAIRDAVQRIGQGLSCVRLDDKKHAGRISDDMALEIAGSSICIADLSGLNPNVMWEAGYAMALGKPMILLSQNAGSLPFDLKDYRVIQYDLANERELSFAVELAIRETLALPRPTAATNTLKRGANWMAALMVLVLVCLGGLYAFDNFTAASEQSSVHAQSCRCDLIHVARGGGRVRIGDDTYIELVRIDTLQGKAEEENRSLGIGHEFNKRLADREHVFAKIFAAAGIEYPLRNRPGVFEMNQGQWDKYLKGLDSDRRDHLKDYPFAKLVVYRGEDELEELSSKYFFKGELLKINDSPPITLELTNVYNTEHESSGEPESVSLRLIQGGERQAVLDQESRRSL